MMPDAGQPCPDRTIGHRVLRFDSLPSTNSYALQWADDPATHGTVILAGAQTAGRGRQERRWLAPPGAGVLLSTIVFAPPQARRPPVLNAWAAVAVCEVAERLTGIPAVLKWPNDVLMAGRKVCGILIEQRGAATVVGIGLNVNQATSDFEEAGLLKATSLAIVAGHPFEVPAVAAELVAELDHWYAPVSRTNVATLEAAWQERLDLEGKHVLVEAEGRAVSGQLAGLRFAQLALTLPTGESLTLVPEAVTRLTRITPD